MPSLLTKHIEEKREFEKDLGNALEIKVRKIKALTSLYKEEFEKNFEIQETNYDRGIRRGYIETPRDDHKQTGVVNNCSFFFNEGIIDCGVSGRILLDPARKDLLICSFHQYGGFRDEPLLGSACVNKDLKLVDRCVKGKSDYDFFAPPLRVNRSCSPKEVGERAVEKFEEFSKKPFAWLEGANKVVDRFLPYIKKVNTDIKNKQKSLKASLSLWDKM